MSSLPSTVLIVGSKSDSNKSLESALDASLPTHLALSEAHAIAAMQSTSFAAVVIDLDSLGADGLHLLNYVARQYPDTLRFCCSDRSRESIGNTAMESAGAFLVPRQPNTLLRDVLMPAIAQRHAIITLKQRLDTKSDLLEIDRRLHPDLDPFELAECAAREMAKLPDVTAAAVYFYNENGEPIPPHPIKGDAEFSTPDLGRTGSTTVASDGHHVYTLRIGDLSNPKAAVALQLSSIERDVVRYLEFVGRHTQQTYRISRRVTGDAPRATSILAADPLRGDGNTTPGTVSASQMSDALTTPSTVTASTADALRRMVKSLSSFSAENPAFKEPISDLKEITIDLKMASDVMSRLLDRLKLIQNDKGTVA